MTSLAGNETELANKNSKWFILVSLFLHLILMLSLSRQSVKPIQKDEIEIVTLSNKEIEKIKGQIVETSKVEKSEKTAPNAYLGEQTQTVKEQTKASTTASFKDGKQGGAGSTNAEPLKSLNLGKLGVAMNLKPMGHLGPAQLAANNDYLNNVKSGSQTLLNTKEFAYFSFYQRVRKQLEQYWEPGLRQRLRSMFEKGRRLATDREHSTRILVVLDQEGLITKVSVEDTSGLLDLDQAAVEAFNKAGPFPNPPKGMIDKDGTVKVEWEFVLKT